MNNSLVRSPTGAAVSGDDLAVVAAPQLHHDLFTPEEILAAEGQPPIAKRKKLARAAKEAAAAQWIQSNPRAVAALEAVSDTVFDPSFGQLIDEELSSLGDPYRAETAAVEEATEEESADGWSDAAIEQLHEGLVMYSLRLLKVAGNGKEKKEILRWIFLPESMTVEVEDAAGNKVWKAIPPASTPFSFDLGCRICGYNPEKLREELSTVLKKLGLDALLKEINDADEFQRQQRRDAALGSVRIELPEDFDGATRAVHASESEHASV